MKIISCSIFFLLTISAFSQKTKVKAVELEYLRTALTPVENLVTDYDFLVEESNMDIKGAMTTLRIPSGSIAYDPRTAFYTGFAGPGYINGFTLKDYKEGVDEPISHVYLKIGILDVASREVVENGHLQGSILPALCYKMQLSVAIELRLSDANRNEFYYRSTAEGNDRFVYKFPEDFKATSSMKGYGTADELENSFQTHRAGFVAEIRDVLVKNWLYETKMDISSRFTNQREKLNVDVYSIKGKSAEYADVRELVTKMDTLFAQLNRDSKEGKTKNWHTSYYRESFSQLAVEWSYLLLNEDKDNPRFSPQLHDALAKNMLWCRFFSGEVEMADIKFSMANLHDFAEDYKKRYDANRAAFGWE